MGDERLYEVETTAAGPSGSLPLTPAFLRDSPSGDVFGLSQNAGMGWAASRVARDPFLVLSTQGGMRADDGRPIALGYHTGHWEVGLLVREVAEELDRLGVLPFAAHVSDPCDGRTQGTTGMFDSLPYRNDAALVLRRLVRSLPRRHGVIGIGTCDKGLPAMMMAVAAFGDLAGAIVPGGVTLPPKRGEDAGAVQSLGARFAHGIVSLDEAADLGCAACATPGGGCQFLGTAATSQVVAEALGLTVPHAALAPSGQPIWLDVARRTAQAVHAQWRDGRTLADVVTPEAIENAMLVHAAFGGSTNLLIHIPAIAHAAGLPRPTVDDWRRVNASVPRLVDALPNGPRQHPTVRVFLAGGVPEVMLHLRRLGLIHGSALTVTGQTWDAALDGWEASERRARLRERLREQDGVDPDDVISSPDGARAKGMTSTVCFPSGNLAPVGSVIKATAIDRSMLDEEGVYRLTGPARVFASEKAAMAAIKGTAGDQVAPISAGDVIVIAGCGPRGTGMEEIAQVTLGAEVPPVRQGGRRHHRRALLGRLDRAVHRSRQPGGARRRPHRPAGRRRPRPARRRHAAARGHGRPRRPGRRDVEAGGGRAGSRLAADASSDRARPGAAERHGGVGAPAVGRGWPVGRLCPRCRGDPARARRRTRGSRLDGMREADLLEGEAAFPAPAEPRLLILACGAIAREVLAVIGMNGWQHVDVRCLPAKLHSTPDRIAGAVDRKLEELAGGYEQVYVAYADCGTAGALDRVLDRHGVERLPGAHCYGFFAGNDEWLAMQDEEPGTFYLTDFLARHFDALVIRGLGLDRHPELLDAMFGNYARVVYLAQTDDVDLLERARAAASRLGLAFEHRRTGYGELRPGLERFVEARWRS